VDPAAWRLLALAFLCMIICSLDRVAMSVAILPMALEFGFSETTKVCGCVGVGEVGKSWVGLGVMGSGSGWKEYYKLQAGGGRGSDGACALWCG
jgi:hypothetical protein